MELKGVLQTAGMLFCLAGASMGFRPVATEAVPITRTIAYAANEPVACDVPLAGGDRGWRFGNAEASSDLYINEIMYAPSGGEPEWIELGNRGASTVSLDGWSVGDANSTRAVPGGHLVPPGGLIVVSVSASVRQFHADIPVDVVELAFPALNNTGDAVRLVAPGGRAADSLVYQPSWGGADGKSLERIDASAPTDARANWSECVDAESGTPGRPNSVRRLDRDAVLARVWNDDRTLYVTVANAGRLPLAGGTALAILDPRGEPQTFVALLPSIPGGDSAVLPFALDDVPAGAHGLAAVAVADGDERHRNDSLFAALRIVVPRSTFVCNEIMYRPSPSRVEWVEYVNRSGSPCSVTSFSLSTGSGTRYPVAAGRTDALVLPAGGFLVIAADSAVLDAFPALAAPRADLALVCEDAGSLGLDDDGDVVVLRDGGGSVLDSIRYDDAWRSSEGGNEGTSLERVHPDFPWDLAANWASCAAAGGGTPGLRNSCYQEDAAFAPAANTGLTVSPNPFSPDGDGRDDRCIVRYTFAQEGIAVRIRVFDRDGRYVKTLVAGSEYSASCTSIWDGTDDEGRPLPIGPYIVLAEGTSRAGGALPPAKAVVVLGVHFKR